MAVSTPAQRGTWRRRMEGSVNWTLFRKKGTLLGGLQNKHFRRLGYIRALPNLSKSMEVLVCALRVGGFQKYLSQMNYALPQLVGLEAQHPPVALLNWVCAFSLVPLLVQGTLTLHPQTSSSKTRPSFYLTAEAVGFRVPTLVHRLFYKMFLQNGAYDARCEGVLHDSLAANRS